MKTVTILVLVQLTLLQEAVQGSKLARSTKLKPKPKLPKCPKNERLEKIKGALGLKFDQKRSGRKRSMNFPIDCTHAAIVQDENGYYQYNDDLYECCDSCRFPDYTICQWHGYPDWLCASQAHQCVCKCRNSYTTTATSTAIAKKAVKTAAKVTSKRKGSHPCRKKICKKSNKACCLQNVCIRLFVHKKSSPAYEKGTHS